MRPVCAALASNSHRFSSCRRRRAASGGEQHRPAEPGGGGSRGGGRWRSQGGAQGVNQQHDDGANEHRRLRPEEAVRPDQEAAAATGYATLRTHRWEVIAGVITQQNLPQQSQSARLQG